MGGPTVIATAVPTPSVVGSRQLMTGRWSPLPAAPIGNRTGAAVVWTGTLLIVWGGANSDNQVRSDGAAYDPATGEWRALPAGPLSARMDPASTWTGSQLLIWGGYEKFDQSQVAGDGATYDPATDRWRLLSPSPLAPRAQATAVWTGAEAVILGGQPAQQAGANPAYEGDGAAYGPTADRWQLIPAPTPPAGHPLMWRTAIQADGELLAWSVWWSETQTGSNGFTMSGGADLFTYIEATGTWQVVPQADGALPDIEEVLWTGRQAVVRGITYNCGPCPGPAVPEATALYDPATNAWTRLSPDPLAGDHMASAWTGDALFSFNPGFSGGSFASPSVTIEPGDASVYDPTGGTWTMLPPAPSGCDMDPSDAPVWTGRQLLLYCAPFPANPALAGYIFTAGP